MIEQEPQSADMCDCILEQIRIVLSVQETCLGPRFIVPTRFKARKRSLPKKCGARHAASFVLVRKACLGV